MLKIGSIIKGSHGEQWRIQQKLGEGRCCEVYKVQTLDEHIQAAARVYRAEFAFVCRRELNLLKTIRQSAGDCKHFTAVLDCLTVDGRSVVLQELLDLCLNHIQMMADNQGMSLYHLHKFASDLARALSVLHGFGYVHADLKPSNIMWSSQHSCLKLIDFGLSFHLSKERDIGVVQSKNYRAPEVVEKIGSPLKQPALTAAIDLWSLGCLLMWVLTGQKVAALWDDPVHGLSGYCENCKVPGSVERCQYEVRVQQQLTSFWEEDINTEVHEKFKDLVKWLFQCQSNRRLTIPAMLEHSFLSAEIVPDHCDLLLLPTAVLRILNAIDEKDLASSQEYIEDLKQAVVEECEKYGPISKCLIPLSREGCGKIYVCYEQSSSSQTAFEKLNGSTLNDHTVITTYYPPDFIKKEKFL
ncbi:hypothetical protein CHS0354_009243 [Potamilus streckersoni]|uniref:Protein kinase domain-containing protein n=1 Tax=Potamilus streckersoni TaxID=2493646 RepID=A0AAE0VWR4_9BIVA|nr:hypothetical protein CHS0354_009243 [Potamilus streckersoni]